MLRLAGLAALAALWLAAPSPAQALTLYVSCLAGHDGGTGSSAIQIRRVHSNRSFTIMRVRAWDENGGLRADRTGDALKALITVTPQPFAGTTLTTTGLFGATNVGRLLIRLDLTDTRTSTSENAPFLIQSIVNNSSPATRISSYCDGGGYN